MISISLATCGRKTGTCVTSKVIVRGDLGVMVLLVSISYKKLTGDFVQRDELLGQVISSMKVLF